ncbi:DUF2254 domain-containing protein [Parvibaculum sp.]|uniref:DUF2254 domain-containing protein n=1 Tax=Parvibaculum sp. TaxID=2024848 RepID=UPI001B272A15|nr:DUF2254 domain-containing protein [Parvibaculum sp.]MBO6634115.1 DUF2254 domain-containing protein [Parvibaculum sp.]MBO6678969.1 DUF2254 domain-containing protein [Parvibaculum sp.]MBO6685818.1 DUF2254 domain-containing protein [Parvibaculum sp.]MBO6903731.1 DUF2254 domain-containing protein [Parvibaculum sp.]
MISKWRWLLLQLVRQIWFRASLFALLGVVTALLSAGASWVIPAELSTRIGSEAVGPILNILASSMLAVTTFSLTVMVTAYSAATSAVTPRAAKLLREDPTTQNVLAVFVGAFLYSLVGLIALNMDIYGASGRAVLFAVTLVVILIMVIALLRWINHLSRLGMVDETSRNVESAARDALEERANVPYMGGRPLEGGKDAIPASAIPICSDLPGYLQHIDMAALAATAEDKGDVNVYVGVLPGAYVHARRPLLWIDGLADDPEDKTLDDFRKACVVGDQRNFDGDPRFGLIVLTEIASRALSPGVNDPGTAIDIIGRQYRLLAAWAERGEREGDCEPACANVFVPPLSVGDMFDDAFGPIGRDGAGHVEVQLRLLKALRALAAAAAPGFRESALHHARMALTRSEAAELLEEEKVRLREIAREMEG